MFLIGNHQDGHNGTREADTSLCHSRRATVFVTLGFIEMPQEGAAVYKYGENNPVSASIKKPQCQCTKYSDWLDMRSRLLALVGFFVCLLTDWLTAMRCASSIWCWCCSLAFLVLPLPSLLSF